MTETQFVCVVTIILPFVILWAAKAGYVGFGPCAGDHTAQKREVSNVAVSNGRP